MIRKLLQSVLCIRLAPLLAAQQLPATVESSDATQGAAPASPQTTAHASPESVTIPKDTKIELVALETVSSETATKGSPVRFAVAKDIVVDGVTVLHAGTQAFGKVTKAKRGIAYHQWADLEIRVKEIQIGNGPKLRLTRSEPQPKEKTSEVIKDLAWCAFPPAAIVCIAFALGASEDGTEKPNAKSGEQDGLLACTEWDFWAKSPTNISAPALAQDKIAASGSPGIPCNWIVGNQSRGGFLAAVVK